MSFTTDIAPVGVLLTYLSLSLMFGILGNGFVFVSSIQYDSIRMDASSGKYSMWKCFHLRFFLEGKYYKISPANVKVVEKSRLRSIQVSKFDIWYSIIASNAFNGKTYKICKFDRPT